jgi:NAD(P)H-hydrate repair Nnr-like enzyme with NAD(P)H-hydrate dehydratase domain
LTSFADGPEELFDAIKAAKSPVVMTPHFGEYAKLFSDIKHKYNLNVKLELARLAAQQSGAVMVVKGADTTVAAPDGKAAIAANAPPWLATAGAGDVLAGIIAGLLAQRVAPFEAAAMGVWIHGEAARAVGPGLIAEDLPEALPAVTRQLYDRFGIDRGRS